MFEQGYEEIKAICTKFQDEFGATDIKDKTFLRELFRLLGKDIVEDYYLDEEV